MEAQQLPKVQGAQLITQYIEERGLFIEEMVQLQDIHITCTMSQRVPVIARHIVQHEADIHLRVGLLAVRRRVPLAVQCQ